MAQTPCVFKHEGDNVDYTPSSAVAGGTVVVQNDLVGIVPGGGIAASQKGSLDVKGIFDVPHDAVEKAAGDKVYWDADGDPVGGTAGSGCFTKTSTDNTYAGKVVAAALATDTAARIRLEQ